MSANNGVIRIGRKGIKKFAFGEDGSPFEVDVVVAFQEWIQIDESFRQDEGEDEGRVKTEDMPLYHRAAIEFAEGQMASGTRGGVSPADINKVTTAEALDFIARLREQYDELADFFQPRRREKEELQGTSGAELRFSVEGAGAN